MDIMDITQNTTESKVDGEEAETIATPTTESQTERKNSKKISKKESFKQIVRRQSSYLFICYTLTPMVRKTG